MMATRFDIGSFAWPLLEVYAAPPCVCPEKPISPYWHILLLFHHFLNMASNKNFPAETPEIYLILKLWFQRTGMFVFSTLIVAPQRHLKTSSKLINN